MGNRIIILLIILMLSLFATAVVIHQTVKETDMLAYDTEIMSKNIHEKEKLVEDILADSIIMKTFENIERYPTQALNITEKHKNKDFIFFFVYNDNKPIFWSTNLFMPQDVNSIHQETTYIEDESRSYIIKKKILGNGSALVVTIPIKRNFHHTNEYLTNKFYDDIIESNNLEVAKYSDNSLIRNIYSKNGSYLFSVKFKLGKYHNLFLSIQFASGILGCFIFLILINYRCTVWAKKGHAWTSVTVFIIILISLRFVLLKINWLSNTSSLKIFDPKYYAYNPFLPNLWEFICTALSFAWIVFYIISIKGYLIEQNRVKKKYTVWICSILGLFSVYFITHYVFIFLSTLFTHTPSVNMEFTNILELSTYSWINIFTFCLSIILVLSYIDLVVVQIKTMYPKNEYILQFGTFVLAFLFGGFTDPNTFIYNVIVGFVVFIRYYTYHRFTRYKFFNLICILLLLSFLSSVIYNRSIKIEELKDMTLTLNYLEAEDDLNALSLFVEIEDELKTDENLKKMLSGLNSAEKANLLSNYIKLNYLNGYLSKYENQLFYYIDGRPVDKYANDKIIEYREKVINNAILVPQTQHFYRLSGELGTHEYFLQMEIPLRDSTNIVQLFINLKNRSYSPSLPYPEILSDNKVDLIREHYSSNAAFALYKDHTLLTQNGNYEYPNTDTNYPNKLNEHIQLAESNGFFHMMIRPDIHTTIIVSKPVLNFKQSLAILSFLFINIFAVFFFVKSFQYIITQVFNKSFNLKTIQYQLIILQNKLKYSTRIQSYIIALVIIVIVSSGAIVFTTTRKQLDKNNLTIQENYISEVGKKIENIIINVEDEMWSLDIPKKLAEINEFSTLDLNIFDKGGRLVYTSQPRVYEIGLSSEYINPIAYNELNVVKKTGVSHIERIGDFEFNSSYSMIKDDNYNPIAFVNIPNYASKKEEIRNSNILLNSLLNIYTILILVSGFLAVFVSRQITKPLSIISRKFAETTLSKKNNEPIYWERDDEIGSLIKQYNLMLVKMEKNTKQLMNAEREYAWREMARQVAHEIKNPLTPMKLGVQQLRRSFQENDLRFEERFLKFSNSFIEQINSLSKIATEFSDFAKLPDTQFVKINIYEKIIKVVHLFQSTPNLVIQVFNTTDTYDLFVLGDKDQLLRTFNNLIKNSIEASRPRKKHHINITLSKIEDKIITINIEDNGMGIPKDIIPKIFQPNFTTKSSGTGLGLAFVKKTIESMKGNITFTTSELDGTTFIITIPAYREG